MRHKPAYLQPADAAAGRWIVSYSDLATVLLVLFVALAAQGYHSANASAAPAAKSIPPVTRAPQIIHEPVPPPSPTQAPAAANNPLLAIEKNLQSRGIKPELENRGLVIALPQAILFPSGQDQIGDAALPTIEQIAEVLGSIPNKITLVGHADSTPIHNARFKNNWELASARSLKLLELLATRYGIEESRLSIASAGAFSPKAPNEEADGRAENRRVEIVILPDQPPAPNQAVQ
jgi:chemotaxis protein MotB